MKSLLLFLTVILINSSATEIFIGSSFTATTFNTNEDWSTLSGDQYFTYNGETYYGLYGTKVGLFKAFLSSTPAYASRLKAKFLVKGLYVNNFIYAARGEEPIQVNLVMSSSEDMLQVIEMDSQFSFNSNSIPLTFFEVPFSSQGKPLWGVREIYLYSLTCPTGCVTCTNADTTTTCSIWLKGEYLLLSIVKEEFFNEGWLLDGFTEDIGDQKCTPLPSFGVTMRGVGIKRSFLLPPHYWVKIKVLLIKMDNWYFSNLQFKIDDKEVLTTTINENPFFANFCGDSTNDSFQPFDKDFTHYSQLIKITITPLLSDQNGTGKGGFRDFQLFYAKCADTCIKCTGPTMAECQETGTPKSFTVAYTSFATATFTGTDGWEILNEQSGSQIYDCSGNYLIGGYNKLGKGQRVQKYFYLKEHKVIKISVVVFAIDNFSNESIKIYVDGTQKFTQAFTSSTDPKNQICGNPTQTTYGDSFATANIFMQHTNPSVFIYFTSTLASGFDVESFGFREFKLYTGTCPDTCASCLNDGSACQAVFTTVSEEYTDFTFTDDYKWSIVTPLTTGLINACGTKSLLGGTGVLVNTNIRLQKLFTLPTHTKIKVKLNIYLIDKWNQDFIIITADDSIIVKQRANYVNFYAALCGTITSDYILQIDEIVDHSAKTLKIEIKSIIAVSGLSLWGIRDFELSYY